MNDNNLPTMELPATENPTFRIVLTVDAILGEPGKPVEGSSRTFFVSDAMTFVHMEFVIKAMQETLAAAAQGAQNQPTYHGGPIVLTGFEIVSTQLAETVASAMLEQRKMHAEKAAESAAGQENTSVH